jgi:hypothetical protein
MITNSQPIIDSRDVLQRIAELEASTDPGELAELSALRTLVDEVNDRSPPWHKPRRFHMAREWESTYHPNATVDFDGVTYWIRR